MQSIDVNGMVRTFSVVGDDAGGGHPRDLLLVFHGSRQTGEVHRRFTGGMYDALTTGGRAVVAYLDGFKGNWNDARKESRFPARLAGIDDVAFTRRVIDRLVATHNVDPARVFAAGFSNGGQMVIRLVHEVPELLAGAAIFSATVPTPENFIAASAPIRPMPILLSHGTADPIIPFEGGRMPGWAQRVFKVGGAALSAPETAAYFADRNGISAPPATHRISAPAASPKLWVSRTDFEQAGLPPVRLVTVHGGGHTIPGPKKAPRLIGRTATDVTAADELAEFLGVGAVTMER